MKKLFLTFFSVLMMVFAVSNLKAQTTPVSPTLPAAADPWKANELLDPAALAPLVKTNNGPLIYNIGSAEDIRTAKHVGPVNEERFLSKFKTMIADVPKSARVVIYCGCCALAKCPNVRPAYQALKAAGFTNVQVLNIAVNLKTNWIAMGYPLSEK